MDLRPRKRQRQITTFVSPPYAILDRMLALVRRFRKENLDIFYKIWGDVLRNVFHMKPAINNGPFLSGMGRLEFSRVLYICISS